MSNASQQIVNKAWNFAEWLIATAVLSAPALTAEQIPRALARGCDPGVGCSLPE